MPSGLIVPGDSILSDVQTDLLAAFKTAAASNKVVEMLALAKEIRKNEHELNKQKKKPAAPANPCR